jgi:hypothetical protein
MLLQIAHPDRILKYVDGLMELRRKHGDEFVLTANDTWLLPMLEFYTEDLEGWMNFVKNVRDRLEPRSPEFVGVNDFYKVVNVRFIQRRTRAILDVAVDLATRKGMIDQSWTAKQLYAKRCIQSWKMRKDNMLNAVRKTSKTGRVSLSHREELLKEFWDMIADEVNNGEIPKA